MTVGDIINSARDLFPDQIPGGGNADQNGLQVSAVTCYRWLNEALKLCAIAANGIRSVTGCPSVTGQNLYQFTGYWREISDVWYDGFTVRLAARKDIFYFNNVTGYSAYAALNQGINVQTIELWPQPPRTSGSTMLSSAISATATTIPVASTSGFVLPFGIALIGPEIVSYQGFTSTTLFGVTRGLGATVPTASAQNTPVQECNIRLAGRAMPTLYSVGSQAATLLVPQEWEALLSIWMLAEFRESEGARSDASQLKKEFQAACASLGEQNEVLAGPRQIGSGMNGRETFYGSVSGGIIVP